MKIVSIIPARGGSKGIPRKNIKLLAGKPLIAHTIEQSVNSKLVSRTIVSTDDKEIADISKKYGAEVVIRPAELAVDTAPSEPTIIHVLDTLKEKEGWVPDFVVFLQCTSPLRKKKDIDNAIQKLIDEKADSLLSVCNNHAFIWKFDKNKGTAVSVNYDYKHRPRRQDREPEYKENGSIYVTRPEIWRKENNRLGRKIALHVMEVDDSWEIDDPFDFWLIEQVINHRKKSGNPEY
ncbi:acylneuraminate cytidylyltransferase [Candidatus Woesearchaeota archaeon CG10_big_fil_rev_8_21_14_0_10_44_13]|nr:MAG: acylneuraminate cytidylyltransferase [Candidatus Woesearchaeota archaeon CG10_big_fil_rev_8_21_14_0_10_44_13]